MTPDQKQKLTQALTYYKEKGGRFSWPDDGVCSEEWSYAFHCAWVRAWNLEGRVTPVEKFMMDFADTWNLDK